MSNKHCDKKEGYERRYVKYYYGGRNASQHRIGRLMLREDGSGAIEYFYGKMGEVTKTVRTLVVPNQAIATYVTQWRYDSHNRLLEMTYPDGERINYEYDLGGQLSKVVGTHFHRYDYVRRVGYDKFGQRIYMQYCNGTETFYSYDARNRRMGRLLVKGKNKGNDPILIRSYQYDDVGNITAFNGTNATFLYPTMHGSYEYDNLYRLVYSSGSYYAPYDSKEARYELFMAYDNMHRIRWKKQDGYQSNFQFEGAVSAGYELRYGYHEEPGRTFQLSEVQDDNYRSREEADGALRLNHRHGYEYDANGNLVHINTARVKKDGVADGHSGQRRYRWDEENRLLAASDGGYVSHYLYDADGERTVKTSGDNDAIYVNSEFSGGKTGTTRFTLYVSPYYVASPGGRYTKHVYIGSQRVVSKLGHLKIGNVEPRNTDKAGKEASVSVDYLGKYAQQLEALKDNYPTFELPYNGADNTDPDEGKSFCCDDGRRETSGMQAAADNFHEADAYQRLQFYYHSDHLGSSTYITNLDAEVTQHIEYVPFGEVFIEERNNTWNTSYLFNAKELDEETGLYYYGARYYDPRLSLWMSVDRFAEKYPYSSPYVYCLENPLKFIDVNGDSTVIDNKGYIKYYNPNDKDLRVFLNGRSIGRLGGDINANGWFNNLLSENVDEAESIFNPFTFRNNVKQYGKWDYKYRSPANINKKTISHILGIAFYRKDKEKGTGDLGETTFTFNGMKGRAEDLNNFHFGVVGKALAFPFTETFMMEIAGNAEMGKWQDDYKAGKRATPQVPSSWSPIVITGYYPSSMGGTPKYGLGSPYGDNPIDNLWIRRGFKHYNTKFK